MTSKENVAFKVTIRSKGSRFLELPSDSGAQLLQFVCVCVGSYVFLSVATFISKSHGSCIGGFGKSGGTGLVRGSFARMILAASGSILIRKACFTETRLSSWKPSHHWLSVRGLCGCLGVSVGACMVV